MLGRYEAREMRFFPDSLIAEMGHIIPRGRGDQYNVENLKLLCAHCNRVKGERLQERWARD